MNLIVLFAVAVVLFSLVKWILIPRQIRRRVTSSSAAVAQAAKLAALKTLELLFCVALFAYGGLITAVVFINVAGDTSSAAAVSTLLWRLRALLPFFEAIDSTWDWFTLIVCGAALALIWKSLRDTRRAREHHIQDGLVALLVQEREKGVSQPEPSPEMVRILDQILKADSELRNATDAEQKRGVDLSAERDRLVELIGKLKSEYERLNLAQWVSIRGINLADLLVNSTSGRTADEQAGRSSRNAQLRWILGGVSKGITVASVFLLFLGVVVSSGPLIRRAVAVRIVKLNDLHVRLAIQEYEGQLSLLIGTPKQHVPASPQLGRTLDTIARRFEDAFARSHVWPNHFQHSDTNRLRVALVRQEILHDYCHDARPEGQIFSEPFGPRDHGDGGKPDPNCQLARLQPLDERTNDEISLEQSKNAPEKVAFTNKRPESFNPSGMQRPVAPIEKPQTALGRKYRDWLEENVTSKSDECAKRIEEAARDTSPQSSLLREASELRQNVLVELSGFGVEPITTLASGFDKGLNEVLKESLGAALNNWLDSNPREIVAVAPDREAIYRRVAKRMTAHEPISDAAAHEELNKIAQDIRVALARHALGEQRRFTLEVLQQASVDKAVQSLDTRVDFAATLTEHHRLLLTRLVQSMPSDAELERRLQLDRYPPALMLRGPPDQQIAQVLERIQKWQGIKTETFVFNQLSAAECLIEFEDWFPGSLGADQRTVYQRTLGLTATTSGAENNFMTSFLFAQAHDFERLAGFCNVGGVVIGRDHNRGQLHHVADLRWVSEGAGLRVFLVTTNNSEIQLNRVFSRRLIRQALAYAADGRPLAATIMSVTPFEGRKVLLHPALIDTSLGSSIVSLDKFVFDHALAGNDNWLKESSTIQSHLELYKLSWFWRSRLMYKYLTNSSDTALNSLAVMFQDRNSNGVLNMSKRIQGIGSSIDYQLIEFALQHPLSSNSPLRSKSSSSLFDKDLVDAIDRITKEPISISGAAQRLAELVSEQLSSKLGTGNALSLSNILVQWLLPPPQPRIVSFVHESEFALDSELSAFQFPNNNEGFVGLSPFRFGTQVAFGYPEGVLTSEGTAINPSLMRWEFDSFTNTIARRLVSWLSKNDESRKVFEEASEFTLLQRLFRVLLNPEAAPNFRVERLAILAHQVRGSAEDVKTPRWDFSGRLLEHEFARTLESFRGALGQAITNAGTVTSNEVSLCSSVDEKLTAAINSIKNAPNPARIDAVLWEKICRFDNLYDQAKLLWPSQMTSNADKHPLLIIQGVAEYALFTEQKRHLRTLLGATP